MEARTFTFIKKAMSARFFKLAMVFMIVCSFNMAKAQSDTIQINFGSNAKVPGWNSLEYYGLAIEPTMLANTKGDTTSIGLLVTGTFIRIVGDGTKEPDPSLGIPASVAANSWYSARGNSSAFMLSGMDPSKEYTFIVFGSIMRVDGNLREGMYTFMGKEEVTVYNNSTNNSSEVAFAMVTPDADGNIMVKCESSPNNAGDPSSPGGNFHLNSLQIIYPNETTGLNPEKTNLMNIFPNPAKNLVNVEVSELSQVKILDITGKVLVETTAKAGKNPINLNLKSGLYLLQVTGADKLVSTTKLVVE